MVFISERELLRTIVSVHLYMVSPMVVERCAKVVLWHLSRKIPSVTVAFVIVVSLVNLELQIGLAKPKPQVKGSGYIRPNIKG